MDQPRNGLIYVFRAILEIGYSLKKICKTGIFKIFEQNFEKDKEQSKRQENELFNEISSGCVKNNKVNHIFTTFTNDIDNQCSCTPLISFSVTFVHLSNLTPFLSRTQLNVQQLCWVSTLFCAGRVAPSWRIFLPVKMASRLNSFVVDVCTKRFTPLHFISQLLQKIRHRRKQKAFSFDGVLAQFVHVAFKRVVTLRLVPSIVLTL